MSNKENKKGTGKRVALIILIVFLALVLLVLVGGTVFITGTLNKLSRPEQNETLSPSEIEALLDDNQYPTTYYYMQNEKILAYLDHPLYKTFLIP